VHGHQFDGLARGVAQDHTRRRILRAVGGVGTGILAVAGILGRAPVVIQAKKKKKKTCAVACPAGADYCVDDPSWDCGLDCACATGTSRTICAPRRVSQCPDCSTDADCDSKTGPGSVCAATGVGSCECNGLSRVCLPPCQNPIPIRCSRRR
jgi:hypothetical protein